MIRFEDFLKQDTTQLNPNQMKAIYALNNCVVSAGAGSGKTTVLSFRFLRLVLDRMARCDEILTLTFTRKAAREMHQRIHKHLLQCMDDEEIAAQLADFSNAPISTLDSFCSTIVRSNSIAYGIGQDFVIDDEKNLNTIRSVATSLLDQIPQSKGAKLLCELYTPDTLMDEVLIPLAVNYYHLPNTIDVGQAPQIIQTVRVAYEKLLVEYQRLLDLYSSLMDTSKTVQGFREDALAMQSRIQSCGSEKELHELLCSSFGHRNAPGAGKSDDVLTIKDTIEEYRSIRGKLCIALSVLRSEDQLVAVMQFMDQFSKEYQKKKRETGILTFADVASLAVQMLKSDTALRSYYKQKYRYIMIDEFQDNNELQKELLYLLSEREDLSQVGPVPSENLQKDKLFFVGDEKQSIYRFRGSDVRVFKALKGELEKVGGESLSLGVNYRSEPGLITLFNELFPKIMQNAGEPYEADFAELAYRSAREGIKSSCTLLIKPYEDGQADEEEEQAQNVDAEAYAVASMMKKMLDSDGYLIPSDQGPRRPKSSDIALLLRSTSNQLSFEKALRRFQIPYTVQAARSLMLEAPANDLYAMLQLVLYPEDLHAYGTVLRSPFCNISDGAIAKVVANPLFEMTEEYSAEDNARLSACKDFYEKLVLATGNQSLSTVANLLWYESGYYLSLVSHPQYQVYVEHFSFFHRLAQLHEEQGKSVSQFVDFLRKNLAQNEKIDNLEVIKEQEEGVQIMSIHKSKGLEFPIVFVADATSHGRSERDVLSTYLDIPLPHYLNTPYHSTKTKIDTVRHAGQMFDENMEKDLQRAELKRLLYVAMTRAETHLVISGAFSKNNRGTSATAQPDTMMLMLTDALALDIQNPVYDKDNLHVRTIGNIAEKTLYQGNSEDDQTRLERLKIAKAWYEDASEPYKATAIRRATTALHSSFVLGEGTALPLLSSDEILSNYTEDQITGFGTFVHAMCELLVQNKSIGDVRKLMGPSLTSTMKERELVILEKEAKELCRRFIESPWYQAQVKPYPLQCEVGFFSAVEVDGETMVAEGSIDLLVKQNDSFLIVDFKTDKFRNENVHRFQVETYMQAMKRIHGCYVRGCVVYLREPSQVLIWEGDRE